MAVLCSSPQVFLLLLVVPRLDGLHFEKKYPLDFIPTKIAPVKKVKQNKIQNNVLVWK